MVYSVDTKEEGGGWLMYGMASNTKVLWNWCSYTEIV